MTTIAPRKQSIRETRRQGALARPCNVWETLRSRIQAGDILPIVGNSVLNDMVFPALTCTDGAPAEAGAAQEGDHGFAPATESLLALGRASTDRSDAGPAPPGGEVAAPPRPTVDEALAHVLADGLRYPFADTSSLARVAQFMSYSYAEKPDRGLAKRVYLSFLKEYLLDDAEVDPETAPVVPTLRARVDQPATTFSDLATALGYPRVPPGKQSPLELLAQLHLPVYVTTSYYDFLERALAAVGREPRTDAFSWSLDKQTIHTRLPGEGYVPDADHPVVYHLYGFEEDPDSIVLSEDDYLDFLLKVARREPKQVFPSYLQARLAVCSLILIGYRPQDWDFRILFRGVLTGCVNIAERPASVAIQLEPCVRVGIENRAQAEQDAEDYLRKYFDGLNFAVEWSDAYTFTADLLGRWEQWRRGQR
ncbi:MAG: SIR2 family protein [Anaerolineae bacterium]|nr:SIR2 family protein [Anaerolineae bacterium]